MDNIFSQTNQNQKSIGWLLLILVGYELAAVFAFNFLGLMMLLPFYDFDNSKALREFYTIPVFLCCVPIRFMRRDSHGAWVVVVKARL